MNEKTKVMILGGLMAMGAALCSYITTLATGGAFGDLSSLIGGLAGAVGAWLAGRKVTSMLAMFLAFIMPMGACQAACRHLTPMPRYGEKINRVMLCPTYWPPLIVDYQGQDWPAENSAHVIGWRGNAALRPQAGRVAYRGNATRAV